MSEEVYYTEEEASRVISLNIFGQTSFAYDLIPDEIIVGKTILDVGANNGLLQLGSRHKDKFLCNYYRGIDINPPVTCFLNIEKADLFNYVCNEKFDLVICIEVLEHIAIRDWPLAIKRLKSFVSDGGYLFLTVPRNERMDTYFSKLVILPYHQRHVVFGITEEAFRFFLPDACIYSVHHPYLWRSPTEGYFRPLLRLIKRYLTRHQHIRHAVVVQWRKMKDK